MNLYGRTFRHGKSLVKDMRSLVIDDIVRGGGNVLTAFYPGSFTAIGKKKLWSYSLKNMEDVLLNNWKLLPSSNS